MSEAVGSVSAEKKAYSDGAFRESVYHVMTLASEDSRV